MIIKKDNKLLDIAASLHYGWVVEGILMAWFLLNVNNVERYFMSNYPDDFKGAAHFDNDDMESDIKEIGLRAEYAEYLADKSNPPIDFLDWANDIHPSLLDDADRAEIAKEKAEKLVAMQAKLNAWTNARLNAKAAEQQP